MLLEDFAVDLNDDRTVDTIKEEFSCLERFFHPSPNISARPEATFYLCPSRKMELACKIMTPEKFKKGRGKELCAMHRAQQKVSPHRQGSQRRKETNELPSLEIRFSKTSNYRFRLYEPRTVHT
jgi:hypothetical protein